MDIDDKRQFSLIENHASIWIFEIYYIEYLYRNLHNPFPLVLED